MMGFMQPNTSKTISKFNGEPCHKCGKQARTTHIMPVPVVRTGASSPRVDFLKSTYWTKWCAIHAVELSSGELSSPSLTLNARRHRRNALGDGEFSPLSRRPIGATFTHETIAYPAPADVG
jgi:hypothetical protein